MPAGLMGTVSRSSGASRIPAQPDFGRMRRERTERVRSIMQAQGIDALVLLGNTNVIYATGAVWPLADSGRTHFEQPVAVVLADDEFPHIWSPVHDDERLRSELPTDHQHGPVYLDFDEGVAVFAAQLAALTSDGAVIAVDEWTHALRRSEFFFAGGPPLAGGSVISRAKLVKTPDELSCMRTSLHITEISIAEVQAQLAQVSARPTSPQPSCARSSTTAPTPTFSSRSGR